METEVLNVKKNDDDDDGDSDNDNDNDNDRLHDHVQEQIAALKSLYLSSSSFLSEEITNIANNGDDKSNNSATDDDGGNSLPRLLRFVVKQGFQVLAVATTTYSETWNNGLVLLLTDVAIRPSSGSAVADKILEAIQRRHDKPHHGHLFVRPKTVEDKDLFQRMGFIIDDDVSKQLDRSCGGEERNITSRNHQQSIMTYAL